MADLKKYEADCVDCGSTLEIDESELANIIECPECEQEMTGTVTDGVLAFADAEGEDSEECEFCGEHIDVCDCEGEEEDEEEEEQA